MSKKQLERHSKKSTSEAEKNKKLVKKVLNNFFTFFYKEKNNSWLVNTVYRNYVSSKLQPPHLCDQSINLKAPHSTSNKVIRRLPKYMQVTT